MIKQILHYKLFKNDSEFTKFQEENNIGIITITPCIYGTSINHDLKNADTVMDLGVFVAYHEKEN